MSAALQSTTESINMPMTPLIEPRIQALFHRAYRKALRVALRPILRHMLWVEYKTQNPDSDAIERAPGYAFALNALHRFSCYWDALDVGTGLSAWPALLSYCGYHVTATDEMVEYWRNQLLFHNYHFYVIRDDIRSSSIADKFGVVTCINSLQNFDEPERAVTAMAKLLKPRGVLIMTFPYNEKRYLQNLYDLPESDFGKSNSYACHVYNRSVLDSWLKVTKLELIEQRLYRTYTGAFRHVGEPLERAVEVDDAHEPHDFTAVAFRKPAVDSAEEHN